MQRLSKISIVCITLFLVILGIFIIIFYKNKSADYYVVTKKIDEYSPDRIVEVYKGKEKINFKYLKYEDGTIICKESQPTISYVDLLDVDEVIVVLRNDKLVKAKIKS